MNARVVYTKPNPKESANPISQLFFWWTKEMFYKGARQDLQLSDLYLPIKTNESEGLGDRLEKYWKYELQKRKRLEYTVDKNGQKILNKNNSEPSLERAIVRAFWAEYMKIGIIAFSQYVIFAPVQPIILGWIINFFDVDNYTISQNDALIYSGLMSLITFILIFLMHHYVLLSEQIGMKVRVATSSLLYRKTLRLSKAALTQTTAGQVVNLLSNDVERFEEVAFFLHFVWITPIQIIFVTVVLWQKVGAVTFVGIGTLLILTIPVHIIVSRISRRLRAVIASLTDKRVGMMNELIAGIQVIKMYAWEKPFSKIVSKIRASEIKKIKASSYVRATYLSIIVFTNRLVIFLTLISYALTGNILTAEVTFMMTTYFDILELVVVMFFPQAIILCGEATVSVRRLEKYLLLDEKGTEESSTIQSLENGLSKFKKIKHEEGQRREDHEIDRENLANDVEGDMSNLRGPVSLTFDSVSANWITSQLPPTLCNITTKFQGGELCAVIGPVGSGKSSLLHLLLGELPIGAGRLKIHRTFAKGDGQEEYRLSLNDRNLKISYASQEAWLFSGTLRENIIFGQTYDRERYLTVTKACALNKDFQQLPHGDLSNVGETGVSLSGGQKARVNLARAVYREADIYLLDDPLSAVDAQVAKHLFNNCIKKYLAGKTRILVTHQLQFVKEADHIVILDRGFVKMHGSYEHLVKLDSEIIKDSKVADKPEEETEAPDKPTMLSNRKISSRRSVRRTSTISIEGSVASFVENNAYIDDEVEEEMESGSISSKVYREYYHEGASYRLLFLLIFIFIISQVATSGVDYWISYWTNLETVRSDIVNGTSNVISKYGFLFNDTFLSSIFPLDENGLLPTNSAIYIYTFCLVVCITTVLLRSFFFMNVCMNSSRNLHDTMFFNILRATMQFFHQNPSGRILNRFSKDVGAMDEILPKVTLEAIQVFLVIIGIGAMVVVVNYWMIIILIILAIVFYYIRMWYLKAAQGVKRLEGVAKSPVFSHVNATLNGLTTIRNTGSEVESVLKKQFDTLQDVHTSASYFSMAMSVALGLILDIIAGFFITCVCFSLILLDAGNTLGGNVGLAISQSLIIIGTLQYGVKQSAEMVSDMTSVERILQYTNLPKEGPWESKTPPPPSWPPKGRLTLKNVYMRYDKNDPPVLKNLNVAIEAGWKVGVVGRTGAGKSSLISALFRLFAQDLDGQIKIDERDTSTLGLHELRSRISIIPQQPFLFSESLRYNLDPFNSYNDAVLWETLREVELNDILLDQMVLQSGSNLSIGQRQLICLARAILRNNRILVLDEATANIDSHTDALIQKTIRTKFADCTVLTIAHRLHTIIDSDRIIVVDDGRIVEFGCPHELLTEKPEGHFSRMVENTGAMMAQSLQKQAEDACLKNKEERSLNLSLQNSIESDETMVEQTAL